MAVRKHLIIGSGSAALSALEEIRRLAPEDEIRLVSMDTHLPYSPATLPYLLSGRLKEADLWRRDEIYFKKVGSTLVRGKEVTQIIPDKKRVISKDGSSENYDTLLIASGAEPVMPTIKGVEKVVIHDLGTLLDCRGLLRELQDKKNVVILGAGLTGMEIAAALLERGCRVSVIEKEPGILPLYFNEEAESYIRDIFIDHKARFFTGKAVTAVERKDGNIRVALAEGNSLNADILINATGTKSRVTFLEGTGINIGTGILVDKRMRTNVNYIYAAGDVAEAQDFFSGKPKMSATIPSAVAQGRVAGTNMAGGHTEYQGGIPTVAFKFLGNMAFSIGLPRPQSKTSQVFKENDDQKRRFKKLVFDEGKLVGAMLLNEKIDPGLILFLIKERMDLTSHKEALFEGTKPITDPWLSSLKFAPVGR